MSHSPRKPEAPTLVLRLSVPAGGAFRPLAAEVAVKIAEYLGHPPPEAKSAGQTIEALVAEVVPNGHEAGDVTFEFHQIADELRIEARCADRSSRARRPLPT
jgi:hypothetical protein